MLSFPSSIGCRPCSSCWPHNSRSTSICCLGMRRIFHAVRCAGIACSRWLHTGWWWCIRRLMVTRLATCVFCTGNFLRKSLSRGGRIAGFGNSRLIPSTLCCYTLGQHLCTSVMFSLVINTTVYGERLGQSNQGAFQSMEDARQVI